MSTTVRIKARGTMEHRTNRLALCREPPTPAWLCRPRRDIRTSPANAPRSRRPMDTSWRTGPTDTPLPCIARVRAAPAGSGSCAEHWTPRGCAAVSAAWCSRGELGAHRCRGNGNRSRPGTCRGDAALSAEQPVCATRPWRSTKIWRHHIAGLKVR